MADAAAVVAPVAPQRMDVVEVGPPPPSTAAALGLDQVPGTEFLDKLEDALQKLAAFTFRRIRETLPAAPSTADIEQACKQWERYQKHKVAELVSVTKDETEDIIRRAMTLAKAERTEALRREAQAAVSRVRRASVTEVAMAKAACHQDREELEQRIHELACRAKAAEQQVQLADNRAKEAQRRLQDAANAEGEQLRVARMAAEQSGRKLQIIEKRMRDLRIEVAQREQEGQRAAATEAGLRRRIAILEAKVQSSGPSVSVTVASYTHRSSSPIESSDTPLCSGRPIEATSSSGWGVSSCRFTSRTAMVRQRPRLLSSRTSSRPVPHASPQRPRLLSGRTTSRSVPHASPHRPRLLSGRTTSHSVPHASPRPPPGSARKGGCATRAKATQGRPGAGNSAGAGAGAGLRLSPTRTSSSVVEDAGSTRLRQLQDELMAELEAEEADPALVSGASNGGSASDALNSGASSPVSDVSPPPSGDHVRCAAENLEAARDLDAPIQLKPSTQRSQLKPPQPPPRRREAAQASSSGAGGSSKVGEGSRRSRRIKAAQQPSTCWKLATVASPRGLQLDITAPLPLPAAALATTRQARRAAVASINGGRVAGGAVTDRSRRGVKGAGQLAPLKLR